MGLLCHTIIVNKKVIYDARASKEINKFPKKVRIKIRAYVDILKETGELREPYAKKLKSKNNLYEIRIKYRGAWRIFYAYLGQIEIIILSGFHKKTQKTPLKEINRAIKRLNEYL
jgi:phage-related protein